MAGEWSCNQWTAIHDHMPGKRPLKMKVEGTCEFPSAGWRWTLKRGNPGINPAPDTLYLDLNVQALAGPAQQPMTQERVHFEEETDQEYRIVLIDHGQVATITVEHPQ